MRAAALSAADSQAQAAGPPQAPAPPRARQLDADVDEGESAAAVDAARRLLRRQLVTAVAQRSAAVRPLHGGDSFAGDGEGYVGRVADQYSGGSGGRAEPGRGDADRPPAVPAVAAHMAQLELAAGSGGYVSARAAVTTFLKCPPGSSRRDFECPYGSICQTLLRVRAISAYQ